MISYRAFASTPPSNYIADKMFKYNNAQHDGTYQQIIKKKIIVTRKVKKKKTNL